MMKRILILAAAALTLAGCAALHRNQGNPYQHPLFIERWLDPAIPLDVAIQKTINELRVNPNSAQLHNQLGQLLRQKGFPKDAEVEFERAVNADSHFFPAWYNLGLVRQARGDYPGALFAFRRTVHYRHGHSEALFQLGLIEEQRHNTESAISYYAKAFSINRALLDVRSNPRILDSKLVDLALLRLYPTEHARESVRLQGTPPRYAQENGEPAPSPAPPPPKPPL